MSARVCARSWLLVAVGCALGLGASRVAEANPSQPEAHDAVVASRATVRKSKDRGLPAPAREGEWIVTLDLPDGLDWQPPPAVWRDVPNGKVRLAVQAEDGRFVSMAGPGFVNAVHNGQELSWPHGAFNLSAHFTLAEVCGGPIGLAVPGLNLAGQASVLRISGEPADDAWRKRHCKAKR
jgi:hypothetical protein